MGRETPLAVARQLRKEAGFGCCVCGESIVEYHHIVPFASDRHFRVEDMMVLCPNHHRQVTDGAMDEAEQRRWKTSPHNIVEGMASGRLAVLGADPALLLGGIRVATSGVVLVIDDLPMLAVHLSPEGSLAVSAILLDSGNNVMLRLVENAWVAGASSAWDIENRWRRLTVRNGRYDVALDVDARTSPCRIKGRFLKDGRYVDIRHDSLKIAVNPEWTLVKKGEDVLGGDLSGLTLELRMDGGVQLRDKLGNIGDPSHPLRPFEISISRFLRWRQFLGLSETAPPSLFRARILKIEADGAVASDEEWRALLELNLGVLYESLGRTESALDYFSAAAMHGDTEDSSRALYLLGLTHKDVYAQREAAASFEASEAKGHHRWSPFSSLELARLALERSEPHAAAARLRAVLKGDNYSARLEAAHLLRSDVMMPAVGPQEEA